MTLKHIAGLASLVLITLICAAFAFGKKDAFELAEQEIMLRQIGHELLLHSGDSTSRVLPVKELAENEFQLRFENEFTFQTDSLVSIVRRSLAKDRLAKDYIVNVFNCRSTGIIFGYTISGGEKGDLIPCSGRKQPKSCYFINIRFQQGGISDAQKGYLLGGLPLLAFIGFVAVKSARAGKGRVMEADACTVQLLGSIAFYPEKRQLIRAAASTGLTATETRLLLIFARSPGIIIERARLQKEIWEDEGVIVGRSLDMFISKLRKKLAMDPDVQLANIHGKGYKLIIGRAVQ